MKEEPNKRNGQPNTSPAWGLAELAALTAGCSAACIIGIYPQQENIKETFGLNESILGDNSGLPNLSEGTIAETLSVQEFFENKGFRFVVSFNLQNNEGIIVGLLCILNPRKKTLTGAQQRLLNLICREATWRLGTETRKVNNGTKRLLERRFASLGYYYKAVLNGTHYLVVLSDLNGIIRTFNTGASNMLLWSTDEVENKKTIIEFHDKNELEKLINPNAGTGITAANYFDALKNGASRTNVCSFIRRNGQRVSVQLSTSCIRNEQKTAIGYISIGEDITEKMKIEEALRISEEKHRIFFDNSQGLMISHDLKGGILSINEAGADTLGYEPQEIIGKNLLAIMPGELKPRLETYLREIDEKGSASGLLSVQHKTGSKKVLFYKNVKMDRGSKAYIIGNAIDVSSRVELEKNLKKAKILAEKTSHIKDQFLANMSHEIRTPMNAIIGFTELLSQSQLGDEQKEFVSAIKTAGENLLGVINDILDFSKIESGNLHLEKSPFNLKELVQSVCNLLKVKTENKKVLLRAEIDSLIPDVLIGDRLRLSQILFNLVGNAVKFTEKGEIEVLAKLEGRHENICKIKFLIRDTGIGIPKEKLNSIFDRFMQVSTETTRKYGGTGLGLSISRNLVGLHGGILQVKSVVKKGSKFFFTLDFEIAKATKNGQSEGVSQNKDKLRKLKVLLVEDNELNQKLAKKVVEGFGFEISIAANGKIGVEMLARQPFDLVLMDLQMPEMDGYQATHYIRRVMRSNVPIIAMTAHSLVGEKDKCLSVGMSDYLSKPFKANDLYYKISQLQVPAPIIVDHAITAHTATTETMQLTRLRELSGNNPEFEKEIIRLFVRDISESIPVIKDVIGKGDYKQRSMACHKLKSSVLLFGLDKIARYLTNLEEPISEKEVKNTWNKTEKLLNDAAQSLSELLKKY